MANIRATTFAIAFGGALADTSVPTLAHKLRGSHANATDLDTSTLNRRLDNPMSCPPADQWCGGEDSENPWAQLSCTPIAYRPFTFNHANGMGDDTDCGNDGPYLNIMANGKGLGDANYPNVNTNAWAGDFTGSGNLDYFVFHGCDGAGLQSDCAGDIKYIERISYRYTDSNLGITDGLVDSGQPFTDAFPDGICGELEVKPGTGDMRTFCKFVHPGTEHVYSDYHGGWWGSDNSDDTVFGSKGMGYIKSGDFSSLATGAWSGPLQSNVLDIPNQFGGEHPFSAEGGSMFSFMMYQWRCEGSTNDNNYFSFPSIAASNRKCFVDNEPGNPPNALGFPPRVEIFFGTLTKCGTKDCIKFLRWDSDENGDITQVIADSGAGSGQDQPYVLYPVHQGDDVPY